MKERNPDQDLQTQHPNSAYGEEQQRRNRYCLFQTCALLLTSKIINGTSQHSQHLNCQCVFPYFGVIKLGKAFSEYWPMKKISNIKMCLKNRKHLPCSGQV